MVDMGKNLSLLHVTLVSKFIAEYKFRQHTIRSADKSISSLQ